MSKTTAKRMADLLRSLHAVSDALQAENPKREGALIGLTLISEFCDKHNVKNFSTPVGNNLNRLRSYVESNCDEYEKEAYLELLGRCDGMVDPRCLSKPLNIFLRDHVRKSDQGQFIGLHSSMKQTALVADEMEKAGVDEAFDALKKFAETIPDRRFSSALRVDLEKLAVIMQNASQFGYCDFWDHYVQISDLLTTILHEQNIDTANAKAEVERVSSFSKYGKLVMAVTSGFSKFIEGSANMTENLTTLAGGFKQIT